MVGAVLDQPPDGNVDLANPELGGAFDVARASVDNAYMDFSTVRRRPGLHPGHRPRLRALGRLHDAAA